MCRQSIQTKWMEPSALMGSKVAAHLAQEGRELVLGHLAAGHGELAMLDATEP
jgi:hypothetical protein